MKEVSSFSFTKSENVYNVLFQCQRNDPSVRHIDLSAQNVQGIVLTPDQLIQLANTLKQNTHVVGINLSGQDLSDEAYAEALERLIQNVPGLQELDLSNTQLNESGLEIWLSALTDHPTLRRLNLSKNNLSAEACYELLSSASGHPTLASLNLGDNPIGDEGAIQLAELLSGDCGLKTLDLKGCGLSDEGGAALLASLEHNTSLVKLNVVKSPQMSRQVRQQINARLKERRQSQQQQVATSVTTDQHQHEDIPERYLCPITFQIMREPVITEDGYTYEREAIEAQARLSGTSPMTREPISEEQSRYNRDRKSEIEEYLTHHPELFATDQVYLPNSWLGELETALTDQDAAKVRRLLGRDPRLVNQILDDTRQVHVLHHVCEVGSPELILEIAGRLSEEQTVVALSVSPQAYTPEALNQAMLVWSQSGDLSAVQQGFQLGASPTLIGETQRTCLHHAVEQGHIELAHWLLTHYPELQTAREDAEGITPMRRAVLMDQPKMANLWCIVEHDTHTPYRESGRTVLQLACEVGTLTMMRQLRDAIGDDVLASYLSEAPEDYTPSALEAVWFEGARTGDLSALSFARVLQVHPTALDSQGYTALHRAIQHNQTQALRYLLLSHDDTLQQTPTPEGEPPLQLIITQGSHELLETWLANSQLPLSGFHNADGQSVLHAAIIQNDLSCAKQLVSQDPAVLKREDGQGQGVLSLAVEQGDPDMVMWVLAQEGVDINAPGRLGRTVLHEASARGEDAMVELLLLQGAEDQRLDNESHSALMLAKAQGHDETVERLRSRLSPRSRKIDRLQDELAHQKTELTLQREQFESTLSEQRRLFEDQLASQHQLIQEQRQLFQQLSERLDERTEQIENKTNRRWEKYKPSFKETRLLSEQGFFSEVQAEQARVRLELERQERQERQERLYPVLIKAVKAGDLDQVQALVEEGADPTYIGTQGQVCAFVEAINHLQYEVVYFLEQVHQKVEEINLGKLRLSRITIGTDPERWWWDTLRDNGVLDEKVRTNTHIYNIDRHEDGRLERITYYNKNNKRILESKKRFNHKQDYLRIIKERGDEWMMRSNRDIYDPRRGWATNDQILLSCVEEYNNFIEWLEARQAEVYFPNTGRYE